MAEEVPLQAAQQLAVNPQLSDPVYPYGEITYVASSSNQPGPSGAEQALPKKGKRRHLLEPKDDINNRKFSQTVISDKNIITWAQFKSQLPKQMHTKKWFNTFKKLNSTAVAKVTWNKYLSAVNKLANYCKTFKLSLHWPLTDKIIHGFVLWALSDEGLHPDTVKAYISAYSCLQKLHGFQGISVAHSPFIKRLLKGAKNIKFSQHPKRKRDPVTFDDLLYIKQKIQASHWPEFNKLAVWCVAVCAFFGSFRIGELLSKKKNTFDATSTLLTKDCTYDEYTQSIKIFLKSPKSGNPQGEYTYLFPFPEVTYCPISTVLRYTQCQRENGMLKDDLPFFRFQSGRAITGKKFNAILKRIFPPSSGRYIIGHSFRPGLISAAANLPSIVNDPHIQGWGRWNTKTFLRYQHFDIEQK
jgi:hypothetical protein